MAQSSKTKIQSAHPETRDANRDPISGAPGAHPVGTGLGATGGAAGGAAVGAAVGGPVGAVVGAAVGGIAGGLAGKGAAEVVNPTAEDAYWRDHYTSTPGYESGRTFEQYQPAYKAGYMGYGKHGVSGKRFEEVEPDLRGSYEREAGAGGLGWDRARGAARAAWERVGSKGGASSMKNQDSSVGSGGGAMSKKSLSQLDSFLRGELSAVGTYTMALSRLAESPHSGALREALQSHQKRADQLRQHIRMGGGNPSETSGVWGAFARLYEGGMAMFGEKAAINALESGEDHGIADFKRGLDDLDSPCLAFMQREILPEQERTHRLIADLKRSL